MSKSEDELNKILDNLLVQGTDPENHALAVNEAKARLQVVVTNARKDELERFQYVDFGEELDPIIEPVIEEYVKERKGEINS